MNRDLGSWPASTGGTKTNSSPLSNEANDQFHEIELSLRPLSEQVSMIRGGVFLKHGRWGKAHPRFVWVSPSDGCIKWRKLGAKQTNSLTRSIPLASLHRVEVGRSTAVFARDQKSLDNRSHCKTASFSLVFSDRTLDLEVDSDGSHREDLIRRSRDAWVKEFRGLVSSSTFSTQSTPAS